MIGRKKLKSLIMQAKITSYKHNAPLLDVQVVNDKIITVPVIGELFSLFLDQEGEKRNEIIRHFQHLTCLEEYFGYQNEYTSREGFAQYKIERIAKAWNLKVEYF